MGPFRYTPEVRAFVSQVTKAIRASGFDVSSTQTDDGGRVYRKEERACLLVHSGRARTPESPLSALGVIVQFPAQFDDKKLIEMLEIIGQADPELTGDIMNKGSWSSTVVIAPVAHWAAKAEHELAERCAVRSLAVTKGLAKALKAMAEAESSTERETIAAVLVPRYNMTLSSAKLFLTSDNRDIRIRMAQVLPMLKPLLDQQATSSWKNQLAPILNMDEELVRTVMHLASPRLSGFEYQSLRMIKSSADSQISIATSQIAYAVYALKDVEEHEDLESAIARAKWIIEHAQPPHLTSEALTSSKKDTASVVLRRVLTTGRSEDIAEIMTQALARGATTFDEQVSSGLTEAFRTAIVRALGVVAWARLGWAPEIPHTAGTPLWEKLKEVAGALNARTASVQSKGPAPSVDPQEEHRVPPESVGEHARGLTQGAPRRLL